MLSTSRLRQLIGMFGAERLRPGAEQSIAWGLCAAVLAAATLEQFVRNRPTYAETFAPDWIPFAAAALAALGIVRFRARPRWLRLQPALLWTGLLLMVWAANGLLLDLLRLTPVMPPGIDWAGMTTRILALAAAVVLAHLASARPRAAAAARPAAWYGYAAFVLALPYPILRTCWALGGTLGLSWAGAAGKGWAPWLLSIPWLLAAVLSLLLVPTWRWLPRRPLLIAGWSATTIVATIGPSACWSLVADLIRGHDLGSSGIATWVFGLFYGSWFLWAIAAGAATRSYQLRSASSTDVVAGVTDSKKGRREIRIQERVNQ